MVAASVGAVALLVFGFGGVAGRGRVAAAEVVVVVVVCNQCRGTPDGSVVAVDEDALLQPGLGLHRRAVRVFSHLVAEEGILLEMETRTTTSY